jgi:hypothetical protein
MIGLDDAVKLPFPGVTFERLHRGIVIVVTIFDADLTVTDPLAFLVVI